jgi:hypothetical protein
MDKEQNDARTWKVVHAVRVGQIIEGLLRTTHDQKKGTINQSSDNIVGRWTHMFSMFHSPVVECEIANQGCHR